MKYQGCQDILKELGFVSVCLSCKDIYKNTNLFIFNCPQEQCYKSLKQLFFLIEDFLIKAEQNEEENTAVQSKICYIVTQELLLPFSVVYQVNFENQFNISLPEFPQLK